MHNTTRLHNHINTVVLEHTFLAFNVSPFNNFNHRKGCCFSYCTRCADEASLEFQPCKIASLIQSILAAPPFLNTQDTITRSLPLRTNQKGFIPRTSLSFKLQMVQYRSTRTQVCIHMGSIYSKWTCRLPWSVTLIPSIKYEHPSTKKPTVNVSTVAKLTLAEVASQLCGHQTPAPESCAMQTSERRPAPFDRSSARQG